MVRAAACDMAPLCPVNTVMCVLLFITLFFHFFVIFFHLYVTTLAKLVYTYLVDITSNSYYLIS